MPKVFDIGACTGTFGAIALGRTSGGVKVSITSSTEEVTTDQDLAAVDEMLTALGIEVDYPMTEMDFETIQLAFPGSTLVTDGTDPSKQKLVVSGASGASLLDFADELVLTPVSGKINSKFTIFKAGCRPEIEFSFEKGKQRIVTLKFKGYVDAVKGLFAIGDTTATA